MIRPKCLNVGIHLPHVLKHVLLHVLVHVLLIKDHPALDAQVAPLAERRQVPVGAACLVNV